MKPGTSLLAIVIITMISSCKVVGTLYPLSDNENDFLFKKELTGKWTDPKDKSESYTVDTMPGTNGKSYSISVISAEKENANLADTTIIFARLLKINQWYFLDCALNLEKTHAFKETNSWLVSKHFFYQLTFTGANTIEITYPDPEDLIKLIDGKKINLVYYKISKDNYLILNKPKENRAALAETKKYPLLYKEKITLVKLN